MIILINIKLKLQINIARRDNNSNNQVPWNSDCSLRKDCELIKVVVYQLFRFRYPSKSLDAQNFDKSPIQFQPTKPENIHSKWKNDLFSQPALSCPAAHVEGDKENNETKIANNRTADFSDQNGLSYSYKVPDQLQVVFPLDFQHKHLNLNER